MPAPPVHRDAAAPVAARVEDLLARMTLEEKLAQLGGIWVTDLVVGGRFDRDGARARLAHGTGHVTRIGASTGLRPEARAVLLNDIQRVLVEDTRLGIPAVVHEESVGGLCARDATVFPQAIGLAATWDPELVHAIAGVIREQMLAVGARHTLAPVLDVARDPRWGRVEETYGEDPTLAGTLGTAYVRGLQTDDLTRGVVCTGKHFLAYGLSEGGMNWAPAQCGPRELREVFAEPFAAAIRDAGLASVMNSYGSVDGLPCAGSAAILDGLLRGELGFDGVVVADYFSVALLQTHHRTAADRGAAAVQALSAGIDVELPAFDCYRELAALVRAGRLESAVVDRAVGRVLRQKFQLGLFERPYVDAAAAPAAYETPAQRALARRAAVESLCLLTNDGILPLARDVRTIAVVGPTADDPRLLQGDYHYPAHLEISYLGFDGVAAREGARTLLPTAGGAFEPGPYYTHHVTPLAALRGAVGAATEVRHARGCDVRDPDPSGIAAAVAAARDADVAIVCVGGRSGLTRADTVGEMRDASDLGLTGAQPALVDAVLDTGTPTVVVVIGGRVHALPAIAARARALLYAWCPGEEGGHALADILFGVESPSGRLPISVPRTVGQVPIHHRHRAGGGRAMIHHDYADGPTTPLFPFGHGLSYTTFAYDGLVVQPGDTVAAPTEVSVRVTNTGSRAGTEVVQCYVRDDIASVARPDRMLVGFARVALVPGETRTVHVAVHPSRLAFYDPAMRFVTEPGTFTVSVGASAVDVRAQATIEIAGPEAAHRQRAIVPTVVRVE